MSLVHDTWPSATIARLLLGDQLHQLRAARRLTLQTVARATYLSESKLSRIECGRHRAAPADIQRLIDLYEAPGALRGQLLKWAARAQGRSVYHSFGDVTDAALRDYLDVEPWAVRAVYAPRVIPAVLQTRRYARELLAEASQAEGERRLWLLALRQQHFARRGGPPVRVLLGEGALTSRIGGGEVMREQAARLREADGLGVEIRVLPSPVTALIAPAGAFALAVLGESGLTMTATEDGAGSPRLVPDRAGRATARFDQLWNEAAARAIELAA
ncbi:Scr1 family TA system antitoxin-like transcriptional regulator [Streptomyces sp. NBC_01538]|uniref:Scr1 family TA system antitoxin-like transcriptional regulator n=1 Tax=Streptomyces sp. NBC_01538 TaxID=2903897 RepID=UPI00386B23D3